MNIHRRKDMLWVGKNQQLWDLGMSSTDMENMDLVKQKVKPTLRKKN